MLVVLAKARNKMGKAVGRPKSKNDCHQEAVDVIISTRIDYATHCNSAMKWHMIFRDRGSIFPPYYNREY